MAPEEETANQPDTVETEEFTAIVTDTQEYGPANEPVAEQSVSSAAAAEPAKPTYPRKMLIAAFVLGIVGTALAVIALIVSSLALTTGFKGSSHSRGPGDFQNGVGRHQQYDRGGWDRDSLDQRNQRDQTDTSRVRPDGSTAVPRVDRDRSSWMETEVEETTTQS